MVGWLEAEQVSAAIDGLHQACLSCRKIQKEMEEVMESPHIRQREDTGSDGALEFADDAALLMASLLDALEQEGDIMVCMPELL